VDPVGRASILSAAIIRIQLLMTHGALPDLEAVVRCDVGGAAVGTARSAVVEAERDVAERAIRPYHVLLHAESRVLDPTGGP
jgi:hypothetical protein